MDRTLDRSPKRALADQLLGGKLDALVAARRSEGRSWAQIALEIRDVTDLTLASESLRHWFRDLPKPEKAA